jgi:hypothetical protein
MDMSDIHKQVTGNAAPELEESVHGLSLHYDGSERGFGGRIEGNAARPAGTLSAVLCLTWVSAGYTYSTVSLEPKT